MKPVISRPPGNSRPTAAGAAFRSIAGRRWRHAGLVAWLCLWLAPTVDPVAGGARAVAAGQPPAAADPERGARVFRRCQPCHTVTEGAPNKLGPNLWAIVGRPVAAAPKFRYSKALREIGGNWSTQRLDGYLANPKAFAPGGRMPFAGLKKAADRADLIAFLARHAGTRTAAPAEPNTDYLGLPAGAGREAVYTVCGACHSIRLVASQGLDRDSWAETLDWMVEEQAMDPLAPERRELVLDYLARYLGRDHRPAR